MSKELQELGQWKVGVSVLIRQNAIGGDQESIVRLEKITDGRGGTIFADGKMFDLSGCQRGGDRWYSAHASIATEADAIRIRGKNARYRLSIFNWKNLDPVKATEIEKLLNASGIDTRTKK